MGQKLARTELFAQWKAGNLVIADQAMSTGKRIFVSSATGTTTGGWSPDAPISTIDGAVGLCTAGAGDIIYVMPGHTETVAAASGLDFDVAGIKVIGLGWGDNRPKIQLSAQASTVEFNADDMWIENLIFEGTFTNGVTAGLDIKTGCDDLMIKNCTIRATASTKELLKGVTIEATNDRITFDGCEFFEFEGGDATAAIFTEGAFTHLTVKNCTFQGDWSAACIDADAAAVTAEGLNVMNCWALNTDATAACAFVTLDDTSRATFTNVMYHAKITNTVPIAANDDGASTVIECYGCEGAGGTYGILWPLTATNYGA
jgi:pectate lyase